uniref:Uncharacterized protein n=1 Tax=Oryza glaberrima TaxID=4538 RepID=I1NN00_ORYGL
MSLFMESGIKELAKMPMEEIEADKLSKEDIDVRLKWLGLFYPRKHQYRPDSVALSSWPPDLRRRGKWQGPGGWWDPVRIEGAAGSGREADDGSGGEVGTREVISPLKRRRLAHPDSTSFKRTSPLIQKVPQSP